MADQKISQLTNYTPPLDADVLPIVDTANVETKKVTWANIKATLEAYFDTLYPAGSGTSTGTNTGDQTDATLPFTDITTNNFSTTKHGFTPKGTNVGNFLKDDGTWATVSADDASTTVKGVVEIATASEITAGTGAGGTGAILVISPDNLATASPTFNAINVTNASGNILGVYTNVSTTSNTTETTLVSTSIPGNMLGTGRSIRVRCYFSSVSNTSTGTAWSLRFKYGASTVVTYAPQVAWTTVPAFVEFVLMSSGATGTQEGVIYSQISSTIAVTSGTSAVDSTSSQTLAVTSQFSNSSASDAMTMVMATVELM